MCDEVLYTQEDIDEYDRTCQLLQEKIDELQDEVDRLQSKYDKIEEQVRNNILMNIPDGGTSCHWCMKEQRNYGRQETLKEVFKRLLARCFESDNTQNYIRAVEIKRIATIEYGLTLDDING